MEDYQTAEGVKEEVLDYGFVEVDSHDKHHLCTACLCATRTTHTLDDVTLKQYYMNILTETQLEAGEPVLQSLRLCWECVAYLKRSVRFREQVQDLFRLLQPMRLMRDKQELAEFLRPSVHRLGRLRTCFAHSINIILQDHDMQASSKIEDHQTTAEIKEEVVDCGSVEVDRVKTEVEDNEFVEVDSHDVHTLCTACLCATRTTRTLDDVTLKQYYMNILTETQLEAGEPVLQSPRLCWECVAHLKRSVRFREQVQDSYRLLQPMLLMCDKEDLAEFLQTSVRRPGRLRTCFAHSINISAQDDDTRSMSIPEDGDDDNKAAVSQCLENNTEPSIFCAEHLDEQFEEISACTSQQINYFAAMESLEDAGEDRKCDIVHQLLCMACLGPGQTLHVLKHQALQLYKTTVNSGQQLVHNVSPRVCWECEILLKKVIHFRERVTECHDILNSSHVTWSEVRRPSRLQKSTVAEIDIPPLGTECSMPEVKQEIEEVELWDSSATEETQPCMACLCGGRQLYNIRDKELKYYTDILNQKMVVPAVSPQLCWECCCMLRQATRFGEKMRQSYETIIPSLLTADIQDITSLLCSGVSLPPRLRRCVRGRVDIPPHAHTHDPPPPVKLEPGSLGLGDSSPPPAGHVQRTDEPATEVKHTSRRDTAHVTTSNITSDRRHRECTSKQQLISNMRAEKSQQCSQCSKSYTPKLHLSRHMITHSGEKPYQCSQCSKAYISKQSLVCHMITHSGEKPYQCSQCTKAYTSERSLVRHMKTHSAERPYQCSQCSNAYTYIHQLAQHMTTHSGEKSYQCSQCSKAYTTKHHLARHMRKHSGEKPYQFSQCTKAYTYKHYLAQHILTHSGEKPGPRPRVMGRSSAVNSKVSQQDNRFARRQSEEN